MFRNAAIDVSKSLCRPTLIIKELTPFLINDRDMGALGLVAALDALGAVCPVAALLICGRVDDDGGRAS